MPAVATTEDKMRINQFIEDYWTKLKDGDALPLESDVSVKNLSAIWDACFLVRVDDDGVESEDFSYVYLGKSLVEAYGDNETNKEICEKLVFPSSMSLVHKFREVVSSKTPVAEESEFVNSKGLLIKYRSSMVPLAKNEGEGVGYILGGMKWKAY